MSCAETAEPIEMSFGLVDSGGLKQPCITWGRIPPGEGAIFAPPLQCGLSSKFFDRLF